MLNFSYKEFQIGCAIMLLTTKVESAHTSRKLIKNRKEQCMLIGAQDEINNRNLHRHIFDTSSL